MRYLAFVLFMLGTPLSLLLNPLMWTATIGYVVARLDRLAAVSAFIEGLFPAPVFYAGAAIALVGNGVLFAQKLITPLRQQQQWQRAANGAVLPLADYLHEQEYGLTFRLLFTPLWWAFTSVSAYRALRKLLIRSQRSAWDKTPHGHELATEAGLARPGRGDRGRRLSIVVSWGNPIRPGRPRSAPRRRPTWTRSRPSTRTT